MIEKIFKYIIDPIIDKISRFFREHKKIGYTLLIIIVFGLIIIPIILNYLNLGSTILNFFNSCSSDKTEKELTIDWLEENFTDSTFNVLIFPFNDYTEDPSKKIKIEKAINDRLDEYRRKELYSSESQSTIRIKFFEEIDPTIYPDSLEKIANTYNTDILIFGNIYDEPKTTTINYIILSESDKWKIFGKEGALKGIAFNSLYEFREGIIIKDLDYLTYWLFCNERLYYKDIKAVYDIWDSIKRIFTENIFDNSNAFLSAIIAEFFQKTNRFFDAKEFYKVSLKYSQTSTVYNNLGLIYEELSLPDSAELCYHNAIDKDSNNVLVYNNLSALYINNNNKIEEAEAFLKKALKIRDDFANAYYNLGLIYNIFMINKELAIKYFKKALTLIPDSSYQILSTIGSSFIDINTDSAKYYLLKALSINKNDYRIYNDFGRLYHKLGDDSIAEKHYFQSLSLNTNNPVALNNLGNLYRNSYDKTDSAFYYYNRAIELNENYFLPYYNIGMVYYEDYKNYKMAKYYFQKSLSLNKYYFDNYTNLAQIYREQEKQLDSAYICYEKAIKYGTQSAGVYNNCGILLAYQYKNYDKAESYLLKAISLDPKLAAPYWPLANLYHNFLGKSKLAEKYYLKTLEVRPDMKAVHLDYAFLLLEKLDDKKKAKEQYLIAIQLEPRLKTKYRDTIFGVKSN